MTVDVASPRGARVAAANDEVAAIVAALEALERIYADRDMPSELVEILTRKAKALSNPEQIAATAVQAWKNSW